MKDICKKPRKKPFPKQVEQNVPTPIVKGLTRQFLTFYLSFKFRPFFSYLKFFFLGCYPRSQGLKLRLSVVFTLKFFCHLFYCISSITSSRRLWQICDKINHWNLSFFSFVRVLWVRIKRFQIFRNVIISLV